MNLILRLIGNRYFFGASLLSVSSLIHALPAIPAAVSAWMSVASVAMGVVSAISSASQQRDSAKYNQQVAENQAISARQQAAANAETQKRSAAKKIGSMQAAYGASGVSTEGSALDILEESARNAEMDRQNIIYGGELRAMGSEGTAILEGSRASNAMSSGYLSAAGTLFKGVSSMSGSPKVSNNMTSDYDRELPEMRRDG
jgi:hypothetical protein